MFYVDINAANDIVKMAEYTLTKPELVYSKNEYITTHNRAKFILNKLKHPIECAKAVLDITNGVVQIPVSDETMSCVQLIKVMQNEKAR